MNSARSKTRSRSIMDLLTWPSTEASAYRYANKVFRAITPRYDLMKALLSFGQERRWKSKAMSGLVSSRAGLWLDLASGTGDVAGWCLTEGYAAHIIAFDLRIEMLSRLRHRYPQLRNSCVVGDLNSLPFRRGTADVVSVAYGLRYIADLPSFLRRAHELLQPGGRLIAFDLGHPPKPLKWIWYTYLFLAGSAIGFFLHGSVRMYWHIVESLRTYPGQHSVCKLLMDAGFVDVSTRSLVAGTMAVHYALKPTIQHHAH